MRYCVAFNISNHRLRRRIVIRCKQAGLHRIQRSVFAGKSPMDKIRELEQQARAEIAATDRFIIIPLDKNAWSGLKLIGERPGRPFNQEEWVRYF